MIILPEHQLYLRCNYDYLLRVFSCVDLISTFVITSCYLLHLYYTIFVK